MITQASFRHPVLEHMSGPAEPAVDLVVFPGAGCGPGFYSPWVAHLPATWRMTGVCLPGRGRRYDDEVFSGLPDAAAEVVRALERSGLVRPLLFGHSMGAVLALETAVRTDADTVFTAACAPPGPATAAEYQGIDEEAVRDDARELARTLGVDDEEVLDDLVELTAPTLLADLAMLARYAPPDGRVAADIVSYYGSADDVEPLPWTARTSGAARTARFPGDHFFPRHHPRSLIRDMSARLGHRASPPAGDEVGEYR
ncbi:thioesterase II family protein [Streptomyces scopuliridis]|uniref:thioesterase II family protein n=1 Tax=Streptomyces scopuliridis TaxID=452529 RepID=UPI0036A8B0BE